MTKAKEYTDWVLNVTDHKAHQGFKRCLVDLDGAYLSMW
jgi:hypothetical protein